MTMGTQKLLVDVGQVNFGAPESLYQSEKSQTIASAGNFTIPSGAQFVVPDGTAGQIQYSPDSSTTWRQIHSTGFGGLVYSDGYNWRVHNNATTAITIHYFTLS